MGVHESGARGQSDWTDQDLLTRVEARERLLAQRALSERALTADDLDPAARDLAEKRLAAIRSLLEGMAAPRP